MNIVDLYLEQLILNERQAAIKMATKLSKVAKSGKDLAKQRLQQLSQVRKQALAKGKRVTGKLTKDDPISRMERQKRKYQKLGQAATQNAKASQTLARYGHPAYA